MSNQPLPYDIIETFFDLHTQYYKNTVLGGLELPQLFILKGRGITIINIMTRNHNPADIVMPMVDRYQPDAYLFCGMGWGIFASSEAEINKLVNSHKSIKDEPDKVEQMIIFGKSKDGTHARTQVYDVIRNESRKVVSLILSHVSSSVTSTKLP